MKHLHTFESFLNESKDEITFSIDDDKLDQILNSKFSRQLDYKDEGGDSFYVLDRKDFDRFIDLADSSGFDVDYENSEDSVISVQESIVNEGGNDGGWIKTLIYRKEDSKEFTVADYKNYGSYQELFAKAKDGEEVEVTLGRPRAKDDFFQNWQTGKPA